MIEPVKELDAELGVVSLLELELLEHGEIHVLEARVPEDVPAHRAKGSSLGRNHHRFALHEAATGFERSAGAWVGSDRLTLRPHRGGSGGGKEGLDGRDATGYTATRRATVSAVWEGTRAGPEVVGVAVEVPAIGEVPAPAEIVPQVVAEPRLGALKADDRVELPALQ